MNKQSFPIPEGCKAVTVEQTGQNIITTFDSAIEKQVGGNHYKKAIQPVQYTYANGLNFFEGNVIKYITRHRSKGGKADLEKAIHYIEMLIEFEYGK